MYRKKKQFGQILVLVLDLIIALGLIVVAGLIRYHSVEELRRAENVELAFWVVGILHVALFLILNVYGSLYRRTRFQELYLSAFYNLILVAVSLFIGFSLKVEVFVSRLMMGYFFLLNTAVQCAVHILIRNRNRIFKFKTFRETGIMIFAERKYVREIVSRFRIKKEINWKIAGVVLLDGDDPALFSELGEEIPVLVYDGKDGEHLRFATQHVVDEVFIQVHKTGSESLLSTLVREFEQMGIVVNVYLNVMDIEVGGNRQVYTVEDYPVVAFSSRLFDYRMVVLKRIIDIFGALIGLFITGLVGIFVAPAILIESPGPLIFKQKRVGSNGRVFNFYKFRSMYRDAENQKESLMSQNEMSGPMFKIEKDPRITKVGSFIRKTSIDELPQFFNVLKGDMSLVGTRPPTLDEYMQYSPYQKRRISFRPGITGLWQVSGRNNIRDFDEVVKLDLEYIDHWSLGLDFKIILKTVGMIFSRRSGAR